MYKLDKHDTLVLSTNIYHHTAFSTFSHNFIPALNDKTFQMWNNKGLSTFNELYTDGHFSSINHLVSRFGLFHSRFHHYLQIRHYVQQAFSDYRIQ